MMQVVEVLKTIQELVRSYFSEEQFTLSRSEQNVDTNIAQWYDSYGKDISCGAYVGRI